MGRQRRLVRDLRNLGIANKILNNEILPYNPPDYDPRLRLNQEIESGLHDDIPPPLPIYNPKYRLLKEIESGLHDEPMRAPDLPLRKSERNNLFYKGTKYFFPNLARVFNDHKESRFGLKKGVQIENIFKNTGKIVDVIVGPEQRGLESMIGSVLGGIFGVLTPFISNDQQTLRVIQRQIQRTPEILRNSFLFTNVLYTTIANLQNNYNIDVRKKLNEILNQYLGIGGEEEEEKNITLNPDFNDSNLIGLQTIRTGDEYEDETDAQTKIPSLNSGLPYISNPIIPDKPEVGYYDQQNDKVVLLHNHKSHLTTTKRKYSKIPLIKSPLFKKRRY